MPAHEHAAPNFQRTPGVSLSPSLKEVLARNANLAAQVGAAILLRRARAEGHRAARLAGHPALLQARNQSETCAALCARFAPAGLAARPRLDNGIRLLPRGKPEAG